MSDNTEILNVLKSIDNRLANIEDKIDLTGMLTAESLRAIMKAYSKPGKYTEVNQVINKATKVFSD